MKCLLVDSGWIMVKKPISYCILIKFNVALFTVLYCLTFYWRYKRDLFGCFSEESLSSDVVIHFSQKVWTVWLSWFGNPITDCYRRIRKFVRFHHNVWIITRSRPPERYLKVYYKIWCDLESNNRIRPQIPPGRMNFTRYQGN